MLTLSHSPVHRDVNYFHNPGSDTEPCGALDSTLFSELTVFLLVLGNPISYHHTATSPSSYCTSWDQISSVSVCVCTYMCVPVWTYEKRKVNIALNFTLKVVYPLTNQITQQKWGKYVTEEFSRRNLNWLQNEHLKKR